LAAAGHPAGLQTTAGAAASQPTPGAVVAAQPGTVLQPGAPPPIASAPTNNNLTDILPAGISPYILALGGLALIWVLVEGVMVARRRTRRRGTPSDGQ